MGPDLRHMTTWRKLFNELGVDTRTLTFSSQIDLDREFDGGYGGAEGEPFIAWSDTHVYASREYDGADYIESLPRHPPKPGA